MFWLYFWRVFRPLVILRKKYFWVLVADLREIITKLLRNAKNVNFRTKYFQSAINTHKCFCIFWFNITRTFRKYKHLFGYLMLIWEILTWKSKICILSKLWDPALKLKSQYLRKYTFLALNNLQCYFAYKCLQHIKKLENLGRVSSTTCCISKYCL